MFYFTCNESKMYESFTFWNKLQEKVNFFTIFYFFEMHLYLGLMKKTIIQMPIKILLGFCWGKRTNQPEVAHKNMSWLQQSIWKEIITLLEPLYRAFKFPQFIVISIICLC